jgi:hypothetical protein
VVVVHEVESDKQDKLKMPSAKNEEKKNLAFFSGLVLLPPPLYG